MLQTTTALLMGTGTAAIGLALLVWSRRGQPIDPEHFPPDFPALPAGPS